MRKFQPHKDRYGRLQLFAPLSPERLITGYSDGEKKRFHEQLKPVVRLYRRNQVIVKVVGFVGLVSWLLQANEWNRHKDYHFFWTVGIFAVLFILTSFPRMPKCPGCLNSPKRLDCFCPECGANALAPGKKWNELPSCSACGVVIDGRRGRLYYKIRHCSTCGLLLDKQGL